MGRRAAPDEPVAAPGAADANGRRAAPPDAPAAGRPGASVPLRAARAAFEQRYIEQVLAALGGNVSHAAAALGMSRAMLHKRLARSESSASSAARRRRPS
jgi:DNA-binding NtrC family response regulator